MVLSPVFEGSDALVLIASVEEVDDGKGSRVAGVLSVDLFWLLSVVSFEFPHGGVL